MGVGSGGGWCGRLSVAVVGCRGSGCCCDGFSYTGTDTLTDEG